VVVAADQPQVHLAAVVVLLVEAAATQSIQQAKMLYITI